MYPRFVEGLYIHPQDNRILYFNPAPPDWITINEKYRPIFDCFDGMHTIETIEAFIRPHYEDESSILVPQIRDFINTSKLFEHNCGITDENSNGVHGNGCLPKYVYLTLTDRCNLRCRYCYAVERQRSDDGGFEAWSRYVEDILSVTSRPVFIFTGGEPLLLPYTYDLAEMTKNRGCENILLTNGTYVNNPTAASKVARLFSLVKISLDTLDEDLSARLRGAGVLPKVQTAFDLLRDADANVQILSTITSLTQNNLDAFSRHFNDQVSFQPFYTMGRGRENENLSITGQGYYNALTETGVFRLLPGFHRNIHSYRNRPFKRCAMAKEEISVDASGNIFPCHMLHYKEFNCGNLNHQGFKKIYQESPILEELRDLDVDCIDQCKSCAFRNICGGACRARVDIKKNGVAGTNDFCDFEKNAILDALLYSYG